MISFVVIFAIGIFLLWFFYILPANFKLVDQKADPGNIFSSESLKSLGDQFSRSFDSWKGSIQNQAAEISNMNLNLNLNANLPRLTNEQIEDLKKKVEEYAQNVNQTQNSNLNSVNDKVNN